MKKFHLLILGVLIAASSVAQTYKIDTRASTLDWLGKKITGASHYGKVGIKSGVLNAQKGELKSGKFVMDMKAISCEDETDPKKNQKLISHLANDDFFSVEKFPEATLEIIRIVPIAKAADDENNYFVFGKLSIRGKTNDIKFPARIDVEKDLLNASASFTIDRSKWDIRYGSGSFFENLGDRAILDNIDFKVKLVGRKQ